MPIFFGMLGSGYTGVGNKSSKAQIDMIPFYEEQGVRSLRLSRVLYDSRVTSHHHLRDAVCFHRYPSPEGVKKHVL